MKYISLTLPSDFDYLDIARKFTKHIFSFLHNEFSSNEISNAELAISEAVTNAIVHGNKIRSNLDIILKFRIMPTKLRIRVMDKGPGFDLDNVPPPNMELPQENGYGIYLIKLKMDHVEYQRGKDWNTMTMEIDY